MFLRSKATLEEQRTVAQDMLVKKYIWISFYFSDTLSNDISRILFLVGTSIYFYDFMIRKNSFVETQCS